MSGRRWSLTWRASWQGPGAWGQGPVRSKRMASHTTDDTVSVHASEAQRGDCSPAPSPRWREDFPVNWEDDHYITRRQFTTFLTLISGALFLGTGLMGLREWWRRWCVAPLTPVRVAQVSEVPVGGVRLFHYPTPDDPCLLIRLSSGRFVAY